jgi:diadenosine tetraphosphate (Ap4A) HIT family hydrolase
MEPDKMNLASLGNMTPHVHWHVVPRFLDDRHFPGPIWAAPQRDRAVPEERVRRAAGLGAAIVARLGK